MLDYKNDYEKHYCKDRDLYYKLYGKYTFIEYIKLRLKLKRIFQVQNAIYFIDNYGIMWVVNVEKYKLTFGKVNYNSIKIELFKDNNDAKMFFSYCKNTINNYLEKLK